jgi:hypothetical protein
MTRNTVSLLLVLTIGSVATMQAGQPSTRNSHKQPADSARVLKVSYYEPARVFEILYELDRRRVGRYEAFDHLSVQDAQARYLTVLSSVLIAFERLTPDRQSQVFDDLLRHVEQRESFDGVESVFASAVLAMRVRNNTMSLDKATSLWERLGPSSITTDGLHSIWVVDPRSGSMIVTNHLPSGSGLVKWLDNASLGADNWIRQAVEPQVWAQPGKPMHRLARWLDGESDPDSVERAINMVRQIGLNQLTAMMPGQPHTLADYVVVIISPVWIGTSGLAVAVGEVALPTLAEAAWHEIKTSPLVIIPLGLGSTAARLYNGPERRPEGMNGRGQHAVINESPGGDAFSDHSTDWGRGRRNGTPSGRSTNDEDGDRSTPNSASSWGDRAGGGRGNGGRQSPSSPEGAPREVKGPDTTDTQKKDTSESSTSDAKGQVSPGDPSVKSYHSLEEYYAGADPYYEELPNDNPEGRSDSDDDLGPRGLKRSRWSAEMMYRIVYGELWFSRHPLGPSLFEKEAGADDGDRLKVGDRSAGQARTPNDDLGNDLPGRLTSSGATTNVKVHLPVPEDFRPMPTKN